MSAFLVYRCERCGREDWRDDYEHDVSPDPPEGWDWFGPMDDPEWIPEEETPRWSLVCGHCFTLAEKDESAARQTRARGELDGLKDELDGLLERQAER